MTAPADRTIKDLSGDWVMNKTLSNPTDEILKLQGIGWVTRKAIGIATITLQVNQYPDSADSKVYHIDIEQVGTGGMKGTTELRVTDSTFRDNKDHIFGFVKGSSTLIRGSKGADGKARPNVQVNTKIGKEADDAKVQRFLRGEILADGSETEGFIVEDEGEEYGEGEGLWLVNWVINQDSGKWTAEQVWGFETIDGQRRYTRRVVVAKDGKYEMARLVYDFVKPRGN